jgi:hypothetical protein
MATDYTQSPFNKQRKDKFLFVMSLPEALRDINKKITRSTTSIQFDSISFSVYGVVVPSISINEIATRYAGQTLHVSSESRPPYTNVTVNFTIDNYFNNYWAIYSWLDLINNQKYNDLDNRDLVNSTTSEVYKSTFTLYGLDEYDNKIIQFDFTKAFPTSLGEINYSYRDAAQIDTSFEFAFDQLITKLIAPSETQPTTTTNL